MRSEPEVRAVHEAMMEHASSGRVREACDLLDQLDGWSADALNSGALADLWWTFCESLGDASAASNPDRAARLYDLAATSAVKEGTYATGAGEGLRSVADVKRIEAKRAAVQKRSQ